MCGQGATSSSPSSAAATWRGGASPHSSAPTTTRCAACPVWRLDARLTPSAVRQDIIVGQSTVGLELLDELAGRELDAVVVPVGGGGLVSGIAAALRHASPSTAVVGCQPVNNACMSRLCLTGRMPAASEFAVGPTLADGTAGGVEEGALTIDLCRCLVHHWVLVPEARIAEGMRLAESLYGAVRGPPAPSSVAQPGPLTDHSRDVIAAAARSGSREPRAVPLAPSSRTLRGWRGSGWPWCAWARRGWGRARSLNRSRAACAAETCPTLRGPVRASLSEGTEPNRCLKSPQRR